VHVCLISVCLIKTQYRCRPKIAQRLLAVVFSRYSIMYIIYLMNVWLLYRSIGLYFVGCSIEISIVSH